MQTMTENKISIRRAVPSDLDFILSELKNFSEFFDTKIQLFNGSEFQRAALLSVINTQVVFVAEKNNDLVGFIAGFLVPHFMNPEIMTLTEMFWWVKKEHRLSRAGMMLLNEFVKFGEENAHWISVGREANSPVRDESFIKRGFKLKEITFVKER